MSVAWTPHLSCTDQSVVCDGSFEKKLVGRHGYRTAGDSSLRPKRGWRRYHVQKLNAMGPR